jgi:hypothetical protein
LLRTLVLLIAVVALALFAEVTRRRSNARSRALPPRRRVALQIAKLMHAGDWNVAPQAIPNLIDALHKQPISSGLAVTPKDLFARDPNFVYCPLTYIGGRGAFSLPDEDLDALRARENQWPRGNHLLAVRHRLRLGSRAWWGMQGIRARRCAEDMDERPDLFDATIRT